MEQKMDILPKIRLTPAPSYQSVGLYMMGPFEVKFHGSRAIHKVWAIVFVCMSTRSVHVELVHKSDADSLLQAITCFLARRPGTKHFVSDNGGNLTKADKVLMQELKEYNKTTVQKLQQDGIKWDFIPVYAPHRGGCWERIIGMIKHHLKALAFVHPPHVKTLETILIQVEAILNRQPLCTVSPASNDYEYEALTPAHALYPACVDRSSNIFVTPAAVSTGDLRSKFLWSQNMVNQFWKAWYRDYLTELHNRQKWRDTKEDLKTGELVLVVDHQMARGHWKMARVLKPVVTGSHVRKVSIRTADGKVSLRDRTSLVRLERDMKDASNNDIQDDL